MGLKGSSRVQQWPAAPCGVGCSRVAGQGLAAWAHPSAPARSRTPGGPGTVSAPGN